MNHSVEYQQAVDAFMRVMIAHVRNGAMKRTMSDLINGPQEPIPLPNMVNLHTWFTTLDQQSQAHIAILVKEVVDDALFSTLAVLDGVAGGYPIPGVLSDFAVYLQTYEHDSMYEVNQPQQMIRINDANTHDHLHDILSDYSEYMDDVKGV
jgi:hypothetical protein